MKKIISLLVAALMTVTCFATAVSAATFADGVWTPTNATYEELEKGDDVVARFAIGSDSHVSGMYYSVDKLNNMYSALGQIGGVDAVLIVGDCIDNGSVPEQYDTMMSIINANSKVATVDIEGADITATGSAVGTTILTMGNHEYSNNDTIDEAELFRTKTGQELNTITWINGVPVIKMSPSPTEGHDLFETDYYGDKIDFLNDCFAEIAEKGYTGPIIMAGHHRIPEEKDSNDYYPKEVVDLLKQHPNVIFFSGHSHSIVQNLYLGIEQTHGFTHVRCGAIGHSYGGSFYSPVTGRPVEGYYVDGGWEDSSNVWIVDVKTDGTAQLRLLNLAKGIFEYENEDIIIGDDTRSYYLRSKTEGYGANTQAPTFPEGAAVTWKATGTSSSVDITFPAATPASDKACDMIYMYRVRMTDPDGEQVTKNYLADFLDDEHADTLTYRVEGLVPGTDYTFEVFAQTAYKQNSKKLTTEGVNAGESQIKTDPELVYDIDYSDGSYDDDCGHELLYTPALTKIIDDTDINKKALWLFGSGGLAYSFNTEDDAKIRYCGYSIECYFKPTYIYNNEQVIFGSWSDIQLGIKINDDGEVYVWSSMNSARNEVEKRIYVPTEIEDKEWIHFLGTYDGENINVYINGEYVGSQEAYGGLSGEVTDEGATFFVGSAGDDLPDGGDPMYPANSGTCINLARLYSGVVSSEMAAELYKEATSSDEPLPFTDVKESDWFYDAVKYVYNEGMMNGTSETTFAPNAKTTRAMLVTVLYRLEGEPSSSVDCPFTDLKQDWYIPAVKWAYENEIVNGMSKTEFSPTGNITREQMATIMYRYSQYKKYDTSETNDLSAYTDASKIGSWALKAMKWANGAGLINGMTTTTLEPGGQSTRAQLATILYRYCTKYGK